MKYVEVTSATPQIRSHIERSLRDALKEDEIKFTITKGDSSSEHDWIVNCTTDKLFDICKKLGFKSWKGATGKVTDTERFSITQARNIKKTKTCSFHTTFEKIIQRKPLGVIKFAKEQEFRKAIEDGGFKFTVKKFSTTNPNSYLWKVKNCTYEQLLDICKKLGLKRPSGKGGMHYSKNNITFSVVSSKYSPKTKTIMFITKIIDD
jgi:hypothetical protein